VETLAALDLRQSGKKTDRALMNIGNPMIDSAVLTEGICLLWLIPLAIVLLMLVRMFKGRAALSETEWRLFFGRPKDKVLTLRYWVRFYATLIIAVALVSLLHRAVISGCQDGFYTPPWEPVSLCLQRVVHYSRTQIPFAS
jgi:hypothetical protein